MLDTGVLELHLRVGSGQVQPVDENLDVSQSDLVTLLSELQLTATYGRRPCRIGQWACVLAWMLPPVHPTTGAGVLTRLQGDTASSDACRLP